VAALDVDLLSGSPFFFSPLSPVSPPPGEVPLPQDFSSLGVVSHVRKGLKTVTGHSGVINPPRNRGGVTDWSYQTFTCSFSQLCWFLWCGEMVHPAVFLLSEPFFFERSNPPLSQSPPKDWAPSTPPRDTVTSIPYFSFYRSPGRVTSPRGPGCPLLEFCMFFSFHSPQDQCPGNIPALRAAFQTSLHDRRVLFDPFSSLFKVPPPGLQEPPSPQCHLRWVCAVFAFFYAVRLRTALTAPWYSWRMVYFGSCSSDLFFLLAHRRRFLPSRECRDSEPDLLPLDLSNHRRWCCSFPDLPIFPPPVGSHIDAFSVVFTLLCVLFSIKIPSPPPIFPSHVILIRGGELY